MTDAASFSLAASAVLEAIGCQTPNLLALVAQPDNLGARHLLYTFQPQPSKLPK